MKNRIVLSLLFLGSLISFAEENKKNIKDIVDQSIIENFDPAIFEKASMNFKGSTVAARFFSIQSYIANFKNSTILGSLYSGHIKSAKYQYLRLASTLIDGDVIFEGNNGVVYIEGDTEIKGKIIGAIIIRKMSEKS